MLFALVKYEDSHITEVAGVLYVRALSIELHNLSEQPHPMAVRYCGCGTCGIALSSTTCHLLA